MGREGVSDLARCVRTTGHAILAHGTHAESRQSFAAAEGDSSAEEEEVIKKHCNACDRAPWHNKMGGGKEKSSPDYRCTFCGTPVTPGSQRALHFNAIRQQQIAKSKP